MKSQAQILIVGRDEMLLQTRQLILGGYFQVQIAGRLSMRPAFWRSGNLTWLCFATRSPKRSAGRLSP